MASFVMTLARIVAFVEVMLGTLGIFWFSDYYFSRGSSLELMVAIVPLFGLFVAIVTPASILIRKYVYWEAQFLFAAGVICVAIPMYRDLHLPSAPDFAAFESRFIPLALLCIFMVHVYWMRKRA